MYTVHITRKKFRGKLYEIFCTILKPRAVGTGHYQATVIFYATQNVHYDSKLILINLSLNEQH